MTGVQTCALPICGGCGEIWAAYESPCTPCDERLRKAVKCHKSKERCSEPVEALNKSPQRAIPRTRAVCGVEFLANIQILAAKSALQPIPIRGPRICGNLFNASGSPGLGNSVLRAALQRRSP